MTTSQAAARHISAADDQITPALELLQHARQDCRIVLQISVDAGQGSRCAISSATAQVRSGELSSAMMISWSLSPENLLQPLHKPRNIFGFVEGGGNNGELHWQSCRNPPYRQNRILAKVQAWLIQRMTVHTVFSSRMSGFI